MVAEILGSGRWERRRFDGLRTRIEQTRNLIVCPTEWPDNEEIGFGFGEDYPLTTARTDERSRGEARGCFRHLFPWPKTSGYSTAALAQSSSRGPMRITPQPASIKRAVAL